MLCFVKKLAKALLWVALSLSVIFGAWLAYCAYDDWGLHVLDDDGLICVCEHGCIRNCTVNEDGSGSFQVAIGGAPVVYYSEEWEGNRYSPDFFTRAGKGRPRCTMGIDGLLTVHVRVPKEIFESGAPYSIHVSDTGAEFIGAQPVR